MQKSQPVAQCTGAVKMDLRKIRMDLQQSIDEETLVNTWLILLIVDPPADGFAICALYECAVIFSEEPLLPNACVMNYDRGHAGEAWQDQFEGLQVQCKIVRSINKTEVDFSMVDIGRRKIGLRLPDKAKIPEPAKTALRDILRPRIDIVTENLAVRAGC
ncbi:MAG: hypothetical protein ABSD70_17770 [Terracidiphilus sp.]